MSVLLEALARAHQVKSQGASSSSPQVLPDHPPHEAVELAALDDPRDARLLAPLRCTPLQKTRRRKTN